MSVSRAYSDWNGGRSIGEQRHTRIFDRCRYTKRVRCYHRIPFHENTDYRLFGRALLIPKELRDRLALGLRDVLELSEASEQMTFKPVRQMLPLEKRRGIRVYTGQAQRGAGTELEHWCPMSDRHAPQRCWQVERQREKKTVKTIFDSSVHHMKVR